MRTKFKNANEAYNYLHDKIILEGISFADTRALFNVGFTLANPLQNKIYNSERNWNIKYAEREWDWYLSGNPNAQEIAKKAPIWYKMMDADGNVRSNYGWQWQRNNQLDYVVGKLRTDKETRHAAITIYDCKEFSTYRNDTPCTYAVQFTIIDDKLNMSVYMRSNDLWYGFCNDQYQFSNLQKMVAERLQMETGWYYHHAHNMHLYNDKI
jgi:thymidylate synthase